MPLTSSAAKVGERIKTTLMIHDLLDTEFIRRTSGPSGRTLLLPSLR